MANLINSATLTGTSVLNLLIETSANGSRDQSPPK